MPFPYVVAKFNKRVTDRFVQPLVRRLAGFAVVHHTGRVTGRPYRTPLYVFTAGTDLYVVLTYGTRADWFQNVQAGGGSLETASGTHRTIGRVDIVRPADAGAAMPWFVRAALRILTVRDVARICTDTSGVRTGG